MRMGGAVRGRASTFLSKIVLGRLTDNRGLSWQMCTTLTESQNGEKNRVFRAAQPVENCVQKNEVHKHQGKYWREERDFRTKLWGRSRLDAAIWRATQEWFDDSAIG